MSMLDWTTPGQTEMGSAGEHPIERYPGRARQTMSRRGGCEELVPGVGPRQTECPGRRHGVGEAV